MKKLIFIFLLMLPIVANAQRTPVSLTSGMMPYTASDDDSITLSANYVSAPAGEHAIIITGAIDVFINLQNDTLGYGQNDGSTYDDNIYAIYVTASYNAQLEIIADYDTTAGGLILFEGGTGASDSSWDCYSIYMNYSNSGSLDLTVSGVDIEITDGWDMRCISLAYADDIYIDGGKFTNQGPGFTRRDVFDAATIRVTNGATGDFLYIDSLMIDCYHTGVFMSNYGAVIENCSMLVDCKNDLYSYPSGSAFFTSALGAGINAWIPSAGTEVAYNIIVAGIENEGCDAGIAFNRSQGTQANPINIHHNTLDIHRGPDDNYGNLSAKGYKGRWRQKYVNFYNNDITVTAHSDSGDHAAAWNITAEGVDWAVSFGESGWPDSFCTFHDNHVEVLALSSGCTVAGIRTAIDSLEWHEFGADEYDFVDAGNEWYDNYISSNHIGYKIGNSDGGSARGFFTQRDTLVGVTSANYDFIPYQVGGEDFYGATGDAIPAFSSRDNRWRDLIYQGEALYDSVDFTSHSNETNAEIFIERTCSIYTTYNDDVPAENAVCSMWNQYPDGVIGGAADVNGLVSGWVVHHHDIRDYTDSTYNDFIIRSSISGDTIWDTVTITPTNYNFTLELSISSEESIELADIFTDFENGAGTNFTKEGVDSIHFEVEPDPGANNYYGWFHFKIANHNERVTDAIVVLTNPETYAEDNSYGGWQSYDDCMMYSYDNVNWACIDSTYATPTSDSIIMVQALGTDTTWFAMSIPFTVTSWQTYADALDSDVVFIDTLGVSETGDWPIRMMTITDTSVSDVSKRRIFITSRQHPCESHATHQLQGLINSIIGDSTFANNFRRDFLTMIVPIMNPDGVDSGYHRKNVNGIDLNRDWDEAITTADEEVRLVLQYIDDWYNISSDTIHLFLDMHQALGHNDYGFRIPVLWEGLDTAGQIYYDHQTDFLNLMESWDEWQDASQWGGIGYGYASGVSAFRMWESYKINALVSETGLCRDDNSCPTISGLQNQGADWAHAIYDYRDAGSITLKGVTLKGITFKKE